METAQKRRPSCALWLCLFFLLFLVCAAVTAVAGYFVYTKIILVEQAKTYIGQVAPQFEKTQTVAKQVADTSTNVLDNTKGVLAANATVSTNYSQVLTDTETQITELAQLLESQPSVYVPTNMTELDKKLQTYYQNTKELNVTSSQLEVFLSELLPLYKEAIDLSNRKVPNLQPANAVQIQENTKFIRDVVTDITKVEDKITKLKPEAYQDFHQDTVQFVSDLNDFISGSADIFDDLLEAYNDRSSSGIASATDAYNRNVAKFKTTTEDFTKVVTSFKAAAKAKLDTQLTTTEESAKAVNDELAKQKSELGI